MRIPSGWLVAALIAVLLAVALTALLPGGGESTVEAQPGPLPQSPPPAPD
jgi:hypothetical protein